MKKSLIALAALAAFGTASAQSTVTLSGLYQFGYQQELQVQYGSATSNANIVQLGGDSTANGAAVARASTRTGKGFAVTDANFKLAAVEDLGGGLSASFDVLFETGNFRGAAVTRADSGIALSGAFGSIAARNTRNSDLIASIGSSAVNLPDGIYDNNGILGRSAIDTVGYTTPELIKGLRASLTYAESNDGAISVPATNSATYIVGAAYVDGPLSIAAAYKSATTNLAASSGLTGKANIEAAVSYDLGVAKVSYGYDAATVKGASSSTTATASMTSAEVQAAANQNTKAAHGFSLTVHVGAVTLGANYFMRGDATLVEVGGNYALSKRSSLIAAYGVKDGLFDAAGYKGSQYRFALRHTF